MSESPAGWYPDPHAPGQPVLRYWDGASWTEHAQWQPPAAAPVPTTPDGAILAGYDKRALAKIIDYAMVMGVASVIELPFFLFWFSGYFDWISSISDPNATPDPGSMFATMVKYVFLAGLISLIGAVLLVGYETVMMRWKAATVGMRVMKIQVRLREAPGPLGWGTIARRVGAMYWPFAFVWIPVVGSLTGIYNWVNYLWPLGNANKQALHDIFAKTNVVLVDPSVEHGS